MTGDAWSPWFLPDVSRETGLAIGTLRKYRQRGLLPDADGKDHGRLFWFPPTIIHWERVGQGVGGGPKPRDRFQCPACGHWCVPYDDDATPGWICSKRGGCGSEWGGA